MQQSKQAEQQQIEQHKQQQPEQVEQLQQQQLEQHEQHQPEQQQPEQVARNSEITITKINNNPPTTTTQSDKLNIFIQRNIRKEQWKITSANKKSKWN